MGAESTTRKDNLKFEKLSLLVLTGHVLGMGDPAIAAQSQKATWFVGRRRLFGISIRGCWQ